MGDLRFFNTLTREVTEFRPRDPPRVDMYSCGPTVYAYQHIGNMRAYVFADTLKRVLRRKGYEVRHVVNITDVGHLTSDADVGDDKLELAARRERRTIWEIADHYTAAFQRDLAKLRVLEPDEWTKATDHIAQMIDFASALASAGWCYQLPSGLYFDTSRLEDYGKLARLDLDGLLEGARVEAVEGGRHRRCRFSVRALATRQLPLATGTTLRHAALAIMAVLVTSSLPPTGETDLPSASAIVALVAVAIIARRSANVTAAIATGITVYAATIELTNALAPA